MLHPRPDGTRSEHPNASYRHIRGRVLAGPPLAACGVLDSSGSSSDATPAKGNDITVGVLMPEKTNTRYAEFDYPIMKAKIEELTANKGKADYENAGGVASVQDKQMQKMIDEKVDIIVLDAVDSHAIRTMVAKAKAAGIPVIAYDRLAEGPIDAYVSFDGELVGEVQGRSLVEALGSNVDTSDKIVMINGSPTDPNAAVFKGGALSELQGKVTIAESYNTKAWDPVVAQQEMTEAINKLGKGNIAAVYSANDAMAAWHHQGPEGLGPDEAAPRHRPGRRTHRRAADRDRRAVHERLQAVPRPRRGRREDRRRQGPGQGHRVRRPHP